MLLTKASLLLTSLFLIICIFFFNYLGGSDNVHVNGERRLALNKDGLKNTGNKCVSFTQSEFC